MVMPKISVIVPVYNTEKYLDICIQSILSQTYTDFELLLIDDGSTDSSGAICDKYAEQDSRVRVFHNENGGASSARNMGLDNAKGEWITFVDSDDWIDIEMFNSLILCQNNADIVISDFYVHSDSGVSVKKLLVDESDIIKRLQCWLKSYTTATSMIIKRRLCNIIRFPIGTKYREDFYFTVQLMYYAKYICKINNPFYHYRHSNELSVTNSGLSCDQFNDIMNMYVEIIDFLKRKGILSKLEKELSYGIIRDKHVLIFDPKRHKEWRNFFPESHKYIATCPYINYRIKILSMLVSWNNILCNAIICFILNITKIGIR